MIVEKWNWDQQYKNFMGFVIVLYLGDLLFHVEESKARYAVQYGVSYDTVRKAQEPHECDWLKAPIGYKLCHYEIRVETVRTAKDKLRGKFMISFDGGVTWSRSAEDGEQPAYEQVPNPATIVNTSVNLLWQKVEEQ
jgi:hypothetical protein